MSYLRDTVIILKHEPFREHDAWITMYGKEYGKMEAAARGARRFDAKALGHLEPFSEVEVMIAKGASFDKLAVAHAIRPRTALRQQLGLMTLLATFIDLIDALTKPGISEPVLFNLLQDMLALSTESTSEVSLARYELLLSGASLKLLDLLGYAPDVETLQISDDARRVLRFSRHQPLRALLTLTAPANLFFEISHAVQEGLKHTPLEKEPHGIKTLAAMLS